MKLKYEGDCYRMKKKKKTVICNDQILPVEGSLLILLRNYYVSTPQFVIKQV